VSKFKYLFRKTIKANLTTIILLITTIVSTTAVIFGLVNQSRLNQTITTQNAQINELIKIKKDFQFGQLVNNDNSLISIEELKKMVKDLKDNQSLNSSSILGTLTTEPDIIISDTLPNPEVTP
jgi:hypothetical protein